MFGKLQLCCLLRRPTRRQIEWWLITSERWASYCFFLVFSFSPVFLFMEINSCCSSSQNKWRMDEDRGSVLLTKGRRTLLWCTFRCSSLCALSQKTFDCVFKCLHWYCEGNKPQHAWWRSFIAPSIQAEVIVTPRLKSHLSASRQEVLPHEINKPRAGRHLRSRVGPEDDVQSKGSFS